MESTRQWQIVYTKEGYEQKVCEALRRKKLDSFCALNKKVRTIYGKERVSYKPVLEKYVFVHVTCEEYKIVKHTDGVINFVYWLSHPAVLNNEDVYMLKRFLNSYSDIILQKINVNIHEPVTIANTFTSDENTDLVTITFPAMGFALSAPEKKTNVKVITLSNHQSKANNVNKYAEAR